MPTHLSRVRLAAIGTVAALFLGACVTTAPVETSVDEGPVASPNSSNTSESPDNGGGQPAQVPAQLQWIATTLDGQEFDGASLLGTPTVLWFWAEWCPICNAEAPGIADASDELPPGVQLFSVPGRSAQDGMERFVTRHGLESITHIVDDSSGSLWANFAVASQPAIVLIDADGNIQTIPGSVGKNGLLQAAESIA